MNIPDGTTPHALDCATAVRKLWDYLDGHLEGVDQEAVRMHVSQCADCFSHADFGQFVLAAVGEVRERETDVESVRERVLSRLRSEGYVGP